MLLAVDALRRLRTPPPSTGRGAKCEFCATALEERHEHVLEITSGALSCACIACALLFDRPGQPLRRLPRDARALDFDLTPREWASLAIPVKLAFVAVHQAQGGDGSVTARYPSPGGVVSAAIAPEVWAEISAQHAPLQRMEPDLEALLLNYLEPRHRLFIVPVDQCYRLAGTVRSAWTGLSGGPEVRSRVRAFCAELRSQGEHA